MGPRSQLAQVEQGAQPAKMNAQASALRFSFPITLGRADLAHQLARTHYARKLPRVLAPEQVARAGLIVRELLLRRRVDLIVVAAPASMTAWKDELEAKFGLSFTANVSPK
jgi:hypothetical protein